MRILELQLLAYGAFTDTVVDLSTENSGLQVIFGPNEAGKSTALRAIRAALFGFPRAKKEADAFLHSKPLVGATLQSRDGDTITFLRRKGDKNTLLHPHTNAPLPKDALMPFLHGMDAEDFARDFGIDHAQLQMGGEEMRLLRGAVGESLFAAALGGSGLTRVLRELEDEATELFDSKKRKNAIKIAKAEYDEAQVEKRQATVPFSRWQQLRDDLSQAVEQRGQVVQRLQQLRAEQHRLQRIRASLPLLAERERWRRQLAELGSVVELPPDYSARERSRIEGEIAQLEPRIVALREKLDGEDGLRRQIASISTPDQIVDHEAEILDLQQRLGAYRKATHDRDYQLRIQREEHISQAERLLRELAIDATWRQADQLRITPRWRRRIQELGAEQKEILATPRRLRARLDQLQREIDSAGRQLAKLGPAVDVGNLETTLRALRGKESLEAELVELRQTLRNQQAQVERNLSALGLWHGDLESLAKLPVPLPETVDRYLDERTELKQELARLTDAIDRLSKQREESQAEIETLTRVQNIPTEADLHEQRAARLEGWETIRDHWLRGDAVTVEQKRAWADGFEKQVAAADNVADRLRREAERVQRLARLQVDVQSRMNTITDEQNKLAGCRRRIAEHEQQWRQVWDACGIDHPLPPREMRRWLEKHAELKSTANQLVARRETCQSLERRIVEYRAKLVARLSDFDLTLADDAPLATLLAEAERFLASEAQQAMRRHELEVQLQRLRTQRRELADDQQRAEEAEQQWRRQWTEAIRHLGCASDATAADANERLHQLGELLDRVEQIRGIDRRIDAIDQEATDFENRVTDLASRVGLNLAETPAACAAELRKRLREAQEAGSLLAQLQAAEVDTLADLEGVWQEQQERKSRLDRLCQLAGAESAELLPDIEDGSRTLVECRAKLADKEQQLLQLGDGLSLQQLSDEAEGENGDDLSAQLIELDREIANLDQQREEIAKRIGDLEKQIDVGDTRSRAAAADQRGLGIIARLHGHAARYLRVRIAGEVLRQQIQRYRAENEDPLLAKASEVFSRITDEAFRGLQIDYDSDQAVIKGLRSGGELLSVDEMSSGTRDQLYLALRLGHLQRHLAGRAEPMPLVVDDILVHFDDERALATLHVLAELAEQTQIILFTHHGRIVELAEHHLPDSQTHHLQRHDTVVAG